MYCIITNNGDHHDLSHCRTREQAEQEFHLRYTEDEIRELDAELIEDVGNDN